MIRIALLAMALGQSATANVARVGCIQPADAQALIVTLMPDTLRAVSGRCAAVLPSAATLRAGAAALAQRWQGEGVGLEASAGAAVGVLMGNDLKGGDPAAMLSLLRTALVNKLVGDIKPASCATIDRAVTLVAPLPARNLSGLAVMLVQAGGARGKASELPICTAATP